MLVNINSSLFIIRVINLIFLIHRIIVIYILTIVTWYLIFNWLDNIPFSITIWIHFRFMRDLIILKHFIICYKTTLWLRFTCNFLVILITLYIQIVVLEIIVVTIIISIWLLFQMFWFFYYFLLNFWILFIINWLMYRWIKILFDRINLIMYMNRLWCKWFLFLFLWYWWLVLILYFLINNYLLMLIRY